MKHFSFLLPPSSLLEKKCKTMNHMENEPYRVSANDLFAQIKELLAQIPPQNEAAEPSVKFKVQSSKFKVHRLLVLACHEAIRNTNQAYGNLFSQVDYLCKKYHVPISIAIAMNPCRMKT